MQRRQYLKNMHNISVNNSRNGNDKQYPNRKEEEKDDDNQKEDL